MGLQKLLPGLLFCISQNRGETCMCLLAETLLKSLIFFGEAPAVIFHFTGALHPFIIPLFHPRDQKVKEKDILCLLARSFKAPASVSTPLTGALPFYWGRFVLTQTAGSLSLFSLLPHTICLHFKLRLKASGSVCLNLQINQATPPTSLGSI